MSKINKLVKQTELFERLAVFSDRNSFLKSLSQALKGGVSDSELHQSVMNVDRAISTWIAGHGEQQKGLPGGKLMAGIPASLWYAASIIKNLTKSQQYDVDQLTQAHDAAKQLMPVLTFADMTDEGKKAWSQLVSPALDVLVANTEKQQQYLASFPVPEAGPKSTPTDQVATTTETVPEQTMSVNTAPKNTSVDRGLQEKLNDILVPSGDILPLDIDGKMGPKTEVALNKFRARYNVPGNFNTEEALQVLKNTAV